MVETAAGEKKDQEREDFSLVAVPGAGKNTSARYGISNPRLHRSGMASGTRIWNKTLRGFEHQEEHLDQAPSLQYAWLHGLIIRRHSRIMNLLAKSKAGEIGWRVRGVFPLSAGKRCNPCPDLILHEGGGRAIVVDGSDHL
ncbi:hypothetical protein CEXT_43581 [Caerostris extrusa]|uniref:Uncharacterized protein n=1 Tax=Caerostris extrusa TaxID=172846 RepID=A0AAV4NM64_CAEEX|nr:hypothetical protein CEXT_43581 [Caerostris extrusa]